MGMGKAKGVIEKFMFIYQTKETLSIRDKNILVEAEQNNFILQQSTVLYIEDSLCFLGCYLRNKLKYLHDFDYCLIRDANYRYQKASNTAS